MENQKRRYWVYLFPAVMDMAVVSLGFFATVRAISLGGGPVLLGMIGTAWGLGYSLTSLLLTRLAHAERSVFFMQLSAVGFILVAIAMALARSVSFLVILSWWSGFWCSFFFVGFQLSMASLASLSTDISVAAYNFSWSVGFALGSLAEGVLLSHYPSVAVSPAVIGSLGILAGLWLVQRSRVKEPSDSAGGKSEGQRATRRSFVLIGWIGLATVAFIGSGFRYLLPEIAVRRFSLSSSTTGNFFFLFFLLQSVVGLFLHRLSRWQYRFHHHLGATFLGLTGCWLAFSLQGKTGLLAFVIFMGIYSGYGFYYGVLYSLKSSLSARDISINEVLVGVTGVVGPLFLAAALKKATASFFLACALLVLTAFLLQFSAWLKKAEGSVKKGMKEE